MVATSHDCAKTKEKTVKKLKKILNMLDGSLEMEFNNVQINAVFG